MNLSVSLPLVITQPKAESTDQAERQEAAALFGQGKRLEALPLLEELVQKNPRDDEMLVALAASLIDHAATLTDQDAAVSAIDVRTGAPGVVRHARGTPETLVLDRVRKADVVRVGDEVVTAGWRTGDLSSLYPRGILVGQVTSVGQTDTDLYQQVQVAPSVDFGSLDAVLVLVPKDRTP